MRSDESVFSRRLLRWYQTAQRQLPWRRPADAPARARPDAYRVLVSEAMLQQTQVATVIPYFHRFLREFPTIEALAAAEEQRVLRLWQGLGYYARARNLLAAARRIVQNHGGRIPDDVERLQELPGIGRYTAGAVASIAYGRRAAIVDANIARVLCRLDCITADPRSAAVAQKLWRRAEQLLPLRDVGDYNAALMELGALVCTPRSPRCGDCPVRGHCRAFASGQQERIPRPRQAKVLPLVRRTVLCIHADGKWLIEQRPATGRWAAMWQFITVPAPDGSAGACAAMTRRLSRGLGLRLGRPQPLGEIRHGLTHRRYEFAAYVLRASRSCVDGVDGAGRRWVSLEGLAAYPMPRPHVRIASLLRELQLKGGSGDEGEAAG